MISLSHSWCLESVSPTLFGGRTNKVTPIMEDLKIKIENPVKYEKDSGINWISRDGIINDLIDLSSAVNIQYEKA